MPDKKPAKCSDCKNELTRVLVYLNGRWSRRVAELQCPNHCDLQCPQCGSKARVTRRSEDERNLYCAKCGWKGHSPDRQFSLRQIELKKLELAEASKKKERQNNLRLWRKTVPGNGTPCHECGNPLLEEFLPIRIISEELVVRKRKILCRDRFCGFKPVVHEFEDKTTYEEWTVIRQMNLKYWRPLSETCSACGQIPNQQGNCGCS
jgi:hypothetical protein